MFGAMPDFNQSLEMFKTMWGNSPTPGNMSGFGAGIGGGAGMPTLDIEELDKRIQDLKSVENWLQLNMNVLRSTIQGLEGLKDADGKSIVPGIFAAVPYCIDLIGGPYVETNENVIKAFRPKSAIRAK